MPDYFKMVNGTSVNVSEDGHGFTKIAYFEEPYYLLVIYCVALSLIFVASLVGNVLTCIVIYYDRTMHTATNYYLFNLAVSDLLVTFPILIFIYQILSGSALLEFEYGKMTCKFIICVHFMVVTILWNNGILVMTVLSIERYIAICYPMMLKGTPVWRRVGKIIAIIWVIALLEALVEAFYTMDVYDTGNNLICFLIPNALSKLLTAIMAVVTFIVPLGIMTFVYTMIAFKVNNNNPKYHFKDTVLNNGSNRNKVNKLITLTVSFVICWLPYFLIRVILVVVDTDNFSRTDQYWSPAHKIAMFNCWFAAALNPLLFSLMSTKFRKALKKLWERRVKKRNVLTEKSFSNTLQTSRITKMGI
ncbi:neuropeptides capa receptor-like isoform X2 [Trichoplusia ni]|uniref:Neuropeptides capa receptor-like isoform X2 n=1 Tax=Trichoplusia ni TaxID=7111 RepID=A0A7E5VY84_TRINI|nr:neuropeptides capa receptor-like isoform X2 [Trichoplusia ni]